MASQIKDDDQKHVLVIDEMNRANLPRVFGELMYLLEYRDKPVDLLYTQGFSLPRNLLFIGTMNTAPDASGMRSASSSRCSRSSRSTWNGRSSPAPTVATARTADLGRSRR